MMRKSLVAKENYQTVKNGRVKFGNYIHSFFTAEAAKHTLWLTKDYQVSFLHREGREEHSDAIPRRLFR